MFQARNFGGVRDNRNLVCRLKADRAAHLHHDSELNCSRISPDLTGCASFRVLLVRCFSFRYASLLATVLHAGLCSMSICCKLLVSMRRIELRLTRRERAFLPLEDIDKTLIQHSLLTDPSRQWPLPLAGVFWRHMIGERTSLPGGLLHY